MKMMHELPFFKHLVNVIDSTILFLVVSHKHLSNEDWWKDIQKEYDLSTRPIPFTNSSVHMCLTYNIVIVCL